MVLIILFCIFAPWNSNYNSFYMAIKQEKSGVKSILIDIDTHKQLAAFCSENNMLMKEFIPMALEYFRNTKANIRSNEMAETESDMQQRLSRIEEALKNVATADNVEAKVKAVEAAIERKRADENQNVINILSGIQEMVKGSQANQQLLIEQTRPKQYKRTWYGKKKEIKPGDEGYIESEEI